MTKEADMKLFKIAVLASLLASPFTLEAVAQLNWITDPKIILEDLKQRLDIAKTPQEKKTVFQTLICCPTQETMRIIERAENNLDQASQIIQEALDKYKGYPE